MSNTIHVPEKDIFHAARMKTYPCGSVEIMVSDKKIFRSAGYELADHNVSAADKPQKHKASTTSDHQLSIDDLERSKRRAATKVRDYALCNDFSYFVTLTLDQQKIERYDHAKIIKPLQQWLDNNVRRNGLKYILIPELHKDGAIHFHGFFNNALPVVDSGTFRLDGCKSPKRPRSERQRLEWLEDSAVHQVFNIPAWRFGFSTAIQLYGNYQSAVSYVCKYIRKGTEKIGGRWYLSGGQLSTPEISFPDLDFRDVEKWDGVYSFAVPEARAKFLIFRK